MPSWESRRRVDRGLSSLILAVAICLLLPALAAAATASANIAVEPCSRSALTPERIAYNDDSTPDEIHAAAGAMYCPNDVWVQITACVQRQTASGWVDVGCVTSRRTRITPGTPGGRGQAVSFEVPCVSGVLRTHVTGGEGLEPTQWDSGPATIWCFTDHPIDTTPPETFLGPPEITGGDSATFTFSSSETESTFECRLDQGPWRGGCTSPAGFGSLAAGDHVFEVRATDAADNTDASPATWNFTIRPPLDPDPDPEPGTGGGGGDSGGGSTGGGGDTGGTTGDTVGTSGGVGGASQPLLAGDPVAGGAPDVTGPAVVIPRGGRAIRATRAGTVRFTIGTLAESVSGIVSLAARGRVLGTRSFQGRAGVTAVVQIRLTRGGRTLLDRRRRLQVQATVTLRDAAGNATVALSRFTLRAHS